MSTISQRELRNDSGEVMCNVEQGQSYTVTRHGVPVARLSPISEDTDLRCVRPARRQVRYSEMARVKAKESSDQLLADLRGDR